jgi:hypothetical protein
MVCSPGLLDFRLELQRQVLNLSRENGMGNNNRVSQKKNSAVPDIASQGIVKIEGLHGGFSLSSGKEILPPHSAK